MCERYSLGVGRDFLRKRYSVEEDNSGFRKSYNLSPSRKHPVVIQDPTVLKDMYWGFIPESHSDVEEWKQKSVTTARSEEALEKHLFREAIEQRRCIVPATGFFKWKNDQEGKPFHVRMKYQRVMSFAGIYSEYEDGKYSYAVLTREANSAVKEVDNRMPVILSEDEEEAWLNRKIRHKMIEKTSPEDVEVYPVSQRVNSPDFDAKELVERKDS